MHPDLEQAIGFHESIVAEGGKALVGYDTAKALANVVLMSEIPTSARRWRAPWRCRSQRARSEEHTSELQSPCNLVCRLLLEKKTLGDVDRRGGRGHGLRIERCCGRTRTVLGDGKTGRVGFLAVCPSVAGAPAGRPPRGSVAR